ncbi:FMN-binding protein [Photobacterium sagamiensis]|uniref:FMN-binding protein n=1 Tax=Photobacterium sagamiensis TaxID=2910241 RepID=UPI003D0E039D
MLTSLLNIGKDEAMKVRKKKKKGISAVNIFAIITLIVAWWVGAEKETGVLSLLTQHYPEAEIVAQKGSDYAFTVSEAGGHSTVYASTGKGYGGPLVVQFSVDDKNRINNIELLAHVDTPGYVVNVINQHFLRQFERKLVSDNFVMNDDVDGVSGATLTSKGIIEAVQAPAHEIATQRGVAKEWPGESYRLQLADAALVALVLLALFERHLPVKIRKYHLAIIGIASVIVIGYWINTSLSLATLSSIALGYWPDVITQPSLYILLAGVVLGIIWLGRNIYCSQLCPFHHIQRWAYMLGRNNWPVPSIINKHSVNIVNFMLWLSLVLIFVSRNPAVSSYEPFSMIFSLDGVGVQWYILPLALIGAFFIKDFWCRLFCPVGRSLNIAVDRRHKLNKFYRKQIAVKRVS